VRCSRVARPASDQVFKRPMGLHGSVTQVGHYREQMELAGVKGRLHSYLKTWIYT
jgi:hypothetical protein